MKKYKILSIILVIVSINISGQEWFLMEVKQPVDSNRVDKKSTNLLLDEMDIPDSNNIDTLADAFNDPNIFIGVFDNALLLSISGKLSAEEKDIMLKNSLKATIMTLTAMHLVKPIKGEFKESIIFVSMSSPPSRSRIPIVRYIPGSKWILALRKTTKDLRIERWGNEIEKYDYFTDDSVFIQFRYGYGALCLNWPKADDEGIPPSNPSMFIEPKGLVKVTESMVEDLETIQKAMPTIKKEIKDSNDTAEIAKTSQALKNDLAKSIFSKIPKEKKKQELKYRGTSN
jgi:hypothetical protein